MAFVEVGGDGTAKDVIFGLNIENFPIEMGGAEHPVTPRDIR